MTFAVEDGSIVEDANSYVTIAFADSYHLDRGNASWTGTDAVKQAALIRATDYIEQKYAGRWKGSRYDEDQALEWPRADICDVDEDVIPARLMQAVCIAALEGLSTDLNPVLDRAVKREKVDVIEVEYMDTAKAGKARPAIDGLLRPYLGGSELNGKVIRV
jgi:hypothetical protein